jgi:hypothetical protein
MWRSIWIATATATVAVACVGFMLAFGQTLYTSQKWEATREFVSGGGGQIGYVALLYEEEAQPKARIELHCQPSSEFRDIGASLYSPNFKAGLETGRWAIPTMRDTYLTFTKDGFVDQIKVTVFSGSGRVGLHGLMPVLMGYRMGDLLINIEGHQMRFNPAGGLEMAAWLKDRCRTR